MHSSESSLRDYFLFTEERFLSSIQNDSTDAFDSHWSDVRVDVENLSDLLSKETADLIRDVSSRVSIIAKGCLEVEREASSLSLTLDSELGALLDEIYPGTQARDGRGTNQISTRAFDATFPQESSGTGVDHLGSIQQKQQEWERNYLYSWITENIHNPYPTASVKKRLAAGSRCSGRALDDWLTYARRRIGWTTFLKRHFKANRSLALDCAHRVLVEGKAQGAYCEEIIHDLKQIKATAEYLYGSTGPSSFAKELEIIEAPALICNGLRKRRLSTCSTDSEQSAEICHSTSYPSYCKHACTSSEDSDATRYMEDSGTLSSGPLSRRRSASLVSNSSSYESRLTDSSFSIYSSASSETQSEIITPAASPIQTKLPVEFFDGWINRVSSRVTSLPHDSVDKPRSSVLSRKRASLELDSETPSKRARFDQARIPTDEKHGSSAQEPRPEAEGTQDAPAPLSEANPFFKFHSSSSEAEGSSIRHVLEMGGEAANQFFPPLSFSIPKPPLLAWDASRFDGTLETSFPGLSLSDLESESSLGLQDDAFAALWNVTVPVSARNLQSPASEEGLAAALALRNDALQEGANSSESMLSSGGPRMDASSAADYPSTRPKELGSLPITLSSLDLAFLESLGSASLLHPIGVKTSLSKEGVSSTLVDIASPSEPVPSAYNGLEHFKKLESKNQLLAEAQKLQLEVFG